MTRWQLQDAKAKLSELVKRAGQEGPQEITVHGKPVAVLVSHEEFRKLAAKEEAPHLVDVLLNSPLRGVKLDLERSKDRKQRKLALFEDEK